MRGVSRMSSFPHRGPCHGPAETHPLPPFAVLLLNGWLSAVATLAVP